MRIRHFGWLANACRQQKLPEVHRAIAEAKNAPLIANKLSKAAGTPDFEGTLCSCGNGVLRISYVLAPLQLEYG